MLFELQSGQPGLLCRRSAQPTTCAGASRPDGANRRHRPERSERGARGNHRTESANPLRRCSIWPKSVLGAAAPVLTERFGFQLPFVPNDATFSAMALAGGHERSVMPPVSGPAAEWFLGVGCGEWARNHCAAVEQRRAGGCFQFGWPPAAISAPLEGNLFVDTTTWTQVALLPGESCLADRRVWRSVPITACSPSALRITP